jgi:hypothetical protein
MQQPGILQPAEPDSLSIGHRRFTERRIRHPSYFGHLEAYLRYVPWLAVRQPMLPLLLLRGRVHP